MAKEVATPKQTAGGGFVFEDKVVGYFLVWMLSGSPPFTTSGPIERIDCQVDADGWKGFDDLLITTKLGQQDNAFAAFREYCKKRARVFSRITKLRHWRWNRRRFSHMNQTALGKWLGTVSQA